MTEELPPAATAFKKLFSDAGADISICLAEDVELRPPTYGKSWFGKALVERLVIFAAEEFGGLNCDKIWRDDGRYVLFNAAMPSRWLRMSVETENILRPRQRGILK